MLFWPFFGDFWCPVVTLLTLSSNLSNFERNHKKPKKTEIQNKKKINKKKMNTKKIEYLKISLKKIPKLRINPKNQKNVKDDPKNPKIPENLKYSLFFSKYIFLNSILLVFQY